jgi:copper transport protein
VPSFIKPLVLLVLSASFLVFTATPAWAHTEFESSSPTDGASVDGPVDEVTLVFTTAAEPAGEAFRILDSAGNVRVPSSADSSDGRTWILQFEPPILEGSTGVRWTVKAPDAHPIEGAFSFTIEDKAAPGSTIAPAVDHPRPAPGAPEPSSQTAVVADPSSQAPTETKLDEFLETSGDDGWDLVSKFAPAARLIGLSGTLLGLGSLVFATLVLRGTKTEVWSVLFWARRGGVLVFVGALLEFVSQAASEAGGPLTATAMFSVATSTFGIAIALRLTGGVALAIGSSFDLWDASSVPDPLLRGKESSPAQPRELVTASNTTSLPVGSVDFAPMAQDRASHREQRDLIWRPTSDSAIALVGAAVLLASYAFDGHTVTKGDRLLTGVVNAIHVAGGAVWLGGIVMLASVLNSRRKANEDLLALPLALRFSVVAAVALTVVGAAGIALSIAILDSVDELWTTSWGQLLIGKVLVVAVAAAAGAYNHFELIPRLRRAERPHGVSEELRIAVTIEAVLLLVALVLTAFLVGAAS